MAKIENRDARLKAIARESLNTFSEISDSAKRRPASGGGVESLAYVNTLTSDAVKKVSRVLQDVSEGNIKLRDKPAIARVVTIDENNKRQTYYICYGAADALDDKSIELASYHSPIGRLAALPVGGGEDIKFPNTNLYLEVLETAQFHPVNTDGQWDSRNTVLAGEHYKPLTVSSLRALIEYGFDNDETEELDRLLEEESAAEIIKIGIRRSVITQMGLREQPILDQHQDKIFRMPLDSRLLILGAPGTGKTTTLIRRLAQKLDIKALNDEERKLIGGTEGQADYLRSWIMFTPTTLLRLYVKEAFNREDVAAPDNRISTWDDFRNDLARNTFGILRTASGRGSFIMNEDAQILEAACKSNPIKWFTSFDNWQKITFAEELRTASQRLAENDSVDIAEIGSKILAVLGGVGATLRPDTFAALMTTTPSIKEVAKNLKALSDRKIRAALNFCVNNNSGFLDELAAFVNELSDLSDDPEDQSTETEEDDELSRHQVGRHGAANHYMRTISTQATARANSRNVGQSTRAGRIIEWLGDRTLPEAELKEIGKSLIVHAALRKFTNPTRLYIDGIPGRYRRFRQTMQVENRWYRAEGFKPTNIHPLEVDLVLLAMVRNTDALIRTSRALISDESPAKETLERLQFLRRAQILVDEATDFSPIQIACMATLANPAFDSFIACGDFNQRFTDWGTRSKSDFNWAVPGIEIPPPVAIAYRQSRKLHELAQKIVKLSGAHTDDVRLPDYNEDADMRPIIATNMSEHSKTAAWLADCIAKIERSIDQLPSIAVFVDHENDVQPLTVALKEALTDQNVRAVACPEGKVLDSDNGVRVFCVEHIKGLEFEAVFFVGLDKLAEKYPDLFDKYLYVGATRAATYLGVTCEGELPDRIAGLRELFGKTWA